MFCIKLYQIVSTFVHFQHYTFVDIKLALVFNVDIKSHAIKINLNMPYTIKGSLVHIILVLPLFSIMHVLAGVMETYLVHIRLTWSAMIRSWYSKQFRHHAKDSKYSEIRRKLLHKLWKRACRQKKMKLDGAYTITSTSN